MIGSLRGLVTERHPLGESAVELVVDVGGVGYRVLVAPRLATAVVPGDGEISLAVHTHVREGALTLYGFSSSEEREAFELLLGAHGVGPALALAIVSVHSPARLGEIVASEDVDALTLVPGVGKKTAARLLIELKSRFDTFDLSGSTIRENGAVARTAVADVADALSALGYATDEVKGVLRELPGDGTPEELLRLALRDLAPRR